MLTTERKLLRRRGAKGSLAVEFVCGCLLASVFVALGLHLGIAKSYQASGFLSAPKMSAPIVYQDFAGKALPHTSPFV